MQNIATKDERAEIRNQKSEIRDQRSEITTSNIYKLITLNNAERLLSLLDRNPYSKTYGSFSRNYWQYKTLNDFPSATDQQGILALTSIYLLNIPENKYFLNPSLLKLIEGSINFWCQIQARDGSFSEWYPNEHSHVATAFTSYGVSESMLLLKQDLNKQIYEKAINCLKKSALWLKRNIDKVVLNHTAGAIAALYNIYLLTNEKTYLEGCKENIETIIKLQDKEGWFPEYGGCDPGYLGVTIDYLAKYWDKSKDKNIENSLEKALNFLIWFYDENTCNTGGEFGHRNIKYILPHGLILLSKKFEQAKYLETSFRNSIIENKTINPSTVDDKYFLFFHLPNYAQSALCELNKEEIKNIRPKSFLKIFPSSGLVSCKQESYQIALNLKKSSLLRLSLKSGLILNDSGYFAILNNGKVLTSQTESTVIDLNKDEKFPFKAELKTSFVECNLEEPYIKNLLIPFRIFNYTFGFSQFFMDLFNRYIKKKLIYQTKPSNLLTLKRKVFIDENSITIKDEISTEQKNLILEKLSIEANIGLMHVPSSKYFHFTELESNLNFNPANLANSFNKNKKLTIRRIIEAEQNKTNIELVTS